MKTFVFVGPTLREVTLAGADVRPPAGVGDVLRASRERVPRPSAMLKTKSGGAASKRSTNRRPPPRPTTSWPRSRSTVSIASTVPIESYSSSRSSGPSAEASASAPKSDFRS